MQIRLNKFLASLGFASRRKADELISDGKVLLNGRKAKLGDKFDQSKDSLQVAGKNIGPATEQSLEYWLLNKPFNVVSTVSDELGRKTVFDYVKSKTATRVYPVGRLDFESEGLLILTNDGELAHRLTHPKYEVKKVYKVIANGIFSQSKVERLLRGVRLAEGKIAFDDLEVLEKDGRDLTLRITIHQGVKREIRRVCAKVGWEVDKLVRVKMGNLSLNSLTVGNVRKLTTEEVNGLRQLVGLDLILPSKN
jgi:23S rRNA pseudouridine2605 synthase